MSEYPENSPEQSEDDKKIANFINGVGCRLELRDIWRNSKSSLVQSHDKSTPDLDGYRSTVFSFAKSVDGGLNAVTDNFDQDSGFFNKRLKREADALEKEKVDAMLNALSSISPVMLGTPETLLPWAREERSALIESLWEVVIDGRENPASVTSEIMAGKVLEASSYLDKLIKGTMNPE